MLPLSIAGHKPDKEWLERLIDTVGLAGPPHAPALRALRRPAAARGGGPRAGVASRPWCSPTSRPATSTRRRPRRCCGCCGRRWTSSARRVVMVTHDPEAAAVRGPAGGAARRRDRRTTPRRPSRDVIELMKQRGLMPSSRCLARQEPAGPASCGPRHDRLAVFLGVALVAGHLRAHRHHQQVVRPDLQRLAEGHLVVITDKQPDTQQTTPSTRFPAALLEQVRQVDGVNAAAGTIFTGGRHRQRRRATIGSQFAPKFISSTSAAAFETLNYVEGHAADATRTRRRWTRRPPTRGDLDVGDTLRIAGEDAAPALRSLSASPSSADTSFGGASIAQLTLPRGAARHRTRWASFDQISVGRDPGVSPDELRARIERVVPPTLRVETGRAGRQRAVRRHRRPLSFLQIVLLRVRRRGRCSSAPS